MRMSRALLAALLLAAGFGTPATASHFSRPCAGVADTNCVSAGRACSVYANVGGVVTCQSPTAGAGVLGSGTITPGLSLVGAFQSVTFTLTFAAGANTDPGLVTASGCVFTGTSRIEETDLVGAGSGSVGGCTTGSVNGGVDYSRQGPIVTITGTLAVNGHTYTIGPNLFVFVPTSTNPVQSYVLVGEITLV